MSSINQLIAAGAACPANLTVSPYAPESPAGFPDCPRFEMFAASAGGSGRFFGAGPGDATVMGSELFTSCYDAGAGSRHHRSRHFEAAAAPSPARVRRKQDSRDPSSKLGPLRSTLQGQAGPERLSAPAGRRPYLISLAATCRRITEAVSQLAHIRRPALRTDRQEISHLRPNPRSSSPRAAEREIDNFLGA